MSDRQRRERRPAKRSLGQNFLVDDRVARRIVTALGAAAGDEVLEIGPGRGALTRHLAGAVRRLVLVELDDALAAELSQRFQGRADVEVLHADVLGVAVGDHVSDAARLHVVGNIPYNITTPILFKLLERPRPADVVLTVQKEVGDRIVALPGNRTYGALAVGVQTVADAEVLFRVGRRSFRPVPRVDSCVLRIRPRRPPPLTELEEQRLRALVRALFQWRRKQLGKTLRDHPDLAVSPARLDDVAAEVGFSPSDRPERLSPTDFVRLAAALQRS